MEMDLGSAIIGAIVIVISALPVILMNRSIKKRKKVLLQSIKEMATQNNCHINQHEIFGSFAIGIDDSKNFVFFYRQTKEKEIKQFVDLGEVQSCKVINTSRTLKRKEGNQKVIDKLELSFIPAMNKPEIKLEFFNADVNAQLYGELQSIEKWSKLINDRLKNKNQPMQPPKPLQASVP